MPTALDGPSVLSSVRAELRESTDQLIGLLDAVADPGARAIGEWTIADTAAHLSTVASVDAAAACGLRAPRHLQPVMDLAADVGIDGVAKLNALTLECEPERDVRVLGQHLADRVEAVLDATHDLTGDAPVRWLGGLRVSAAGVLSHLVSELLIHGRDIALAADLAWPVRATGARLFFDPFLLDVLRSPAIGDLAGPSGPSSRDEVAWEMRLRGLPATTFAAGGGRIVVDEPGGRRAVDLHVAAEPGAMLLVMFDRMSPVEAVRRRQLAVWGRRPWRIRRLMRVMTTP